MATRICLEVPGGVMPHIIRVRLIQGRMPVVFARLPWMGDEEREVNLHIPIEQIFEIVRDGARLAALIVSQAEEVQRTKFDSVTEERTTWWFPNRGKG